MASEVQICNLALSHIGTYKIENLDDVSGKLARSCNLLYEPVRDAVLRAQAWGFANKRKILALLTESYSGWDYAYAYPTDCIKALKIFDVTGEATGTSYDVDTDSYVQVGEVEYEIGISDDLTQKIILTDKEDAELLYTAKVTTPNVFDTLFIKALSYALAVELCQTVKADKALKKELEATYSRLINSTKAESANESQKKPDDKHNSFVSARE